MKKMTRWLSMMVVLLLLLGGCASVPKPKQTQQHACPAAPQAKPSSAPQESLLELVPGAAVAAIVARTNGLSGPMSWISNRSMEMRTELARHLTETLGVDLTALRGFVVFATQLGPTPEAAAVLRIDGISPATVLKGKAAGLYRGHKLIRVPDKLVAGIVPTGVVVGTPTAVRKAIDVSDKRAAALSERSILGDLITAGSEATEFLVGVDLTSVKQLSQQGARFGMRVATLTVDPDRQLTVKVSGDPSLMTPAVAMMRGALAMTLAKVRQELDSARQSKDAFTGAGAIIAFYNWRDMVNEIEPRMEREQLVVRYRFPSFDAATGTVFFGGILAAVAIPAFIKYMRRSKATEAHANLTALQQQLKELVSNHRGPLSRFRFPATTPWAPPKSCCAMTAGDAKCPAGSVRFDHPTWRKLKFAISDAQYYQYRITSAGRGAQATVTIEAQGDLDCDNTSSSFKVHGRFEAGQLTFTQPIVTDELE